jgi:hypothetical protein
MRSSVTSPLPKYGPTPDYGFCESGECSSAARATCSVCDGHYCLGHAEHAEHAEHEDRARKG